MAADTAAPRAGFLMPAFQLTEYPSGRTISSKDLIGKPVFINFWTSWCTYCRLETPDLVKAHQKYGDKVTFLSVNVASQDDRQAMAKFVQQYHMTWTIGLDTAGEAVKTYQVLGYPTSFFVNRQGVIVDVNVGALSAANMETQLERISH